MQTRFTAAQRRDPHVAESERILRNCVHCGFCTATCPTYVTEGSELDSPRGRIVLIQAMLEENRPADAETVRHIDRCLSCLACTTTCPSGVHYGHLVDHARAHIEKTFRRPWRERALRWSLRRVLPHPARFRVALRAARLAKPFAPLFQRTKGLESVAAMLALAPARLPARQRRAAFPPRSVNPKRVALLAGCAQSVLDPAINAAAARLLARFGVAVAPAPGEGCCGALSHHLGAEAEALRFARANVDAWTRLIESDGLDAILVTTSGCGTVLKDYGFMLRLDPRYREKAARVSALARDITEFLATLDLPENPSRGLAVAYHAACSLQHGQRVVREPKALLARAGFTVREPKEAHLCCGSAGTYNILQPAISAKLKARKAAALAATNAPVIAAGNIGCLTQIASAISTPVVHTVELLDWAYGGPAPAALANRERAA